MRKFWRNRNQECAANGQSRRWFRLKEKEEEGQGLVEAAVTFVFLLAIFIAMFEMVMLFTSYIALLNTSIQGAVYAAGHPNMVANPPDSSYEQYVSIMRAEALAGGLSERDIGYSLPQLPTNVAPGEALTVTIEYTMTTFASEIAFPLFGRFGLPEVFRIRASSAVPIR